MHLVGALVFDEAAVVAAEGDDEEDGGDVLEAVDPWRAGEGEEGGVSSSSQLRAQASCSHFLRSERWPPTSKMR